MNGVYLIGSRDYGWYKIGMAESVEDRIATVARNVPFQLEHVLTWPFHRPRLLEATIRALLADRRIWAEWFKLADADIQTMHGILRNHPLYAQCYPTTTGVGAILVGAPKRKAHGLLNQSLASAREQIQ
jgi:hypothetical protein